MKSHSLGPFVFALTSFVTANPLVRRGGLGGSESSPLFGGSDGSSGFGVQPSPGVFTDNDKENEGMQCSVQLYEFWGQMKRRDQCTDGLSVAKGLFILGGSFAWDKQQQENNPSYFDGDQIQCCLHVQCIQSGTEDKGFCTNVGKDCSAGLALEDKPFSGLPKAFCPGVNTKCCILQKQGALPSSDTLTASGPSSADLNPIIPTDELSISPADNLFASTDGSAPLIDPGELQVSYDPNLPALGDGTTFSSPNGGSEEGGNLFASLGEDTTETGSPIDFWT